MSGFVKIHRFNPSEIKGYLKKGGKKVTEIKYLKKTKNKGATKMQLLYYTSGLLKSKALKIN